MKRIIMSFLIHAICGILYATPLSTVTLKNGTVVRGHIVRQRFGNDVTIEAKKATIVIEPNDIVSKKTRKVMYENLSREMQRWVLENKALKGDAYGRYAELEDISTKSNSYTGLVIKNLNGRETYIQVSPTTFNIKWDDIQTIDKAESKDSTYNLMDKVTTFADKTYEGKIVSQKTGESLTIETSTERVTILNKDIKEIRKTSTKESSNPFNEIDFLNIIVLKDGNEKEGLISSQHYGRNEKDNYITLLEKNGKTELILISNISEQRTKYNKKDISPYALGKVYINEFKINNAKSQRISNDIVFLDKQIFPFPEGIGITFKSNGISLNTGWSLITLTEHQTSAGKNSWGYSIANKRDITIPCSHCDKSFGINEITYGYLSPGYYALVNDADTEAYIFKITK